MWLDIISIFHNLTVVLLDRWPTVELYLLVLIKASALGPVQKPRRLGLVPIAYLLGNVQEISGNDFEKRWVSVIFLN